jgi:hypothetical protein
MVDGLSRQQIAQRLYLSPNTVRTHVQHVLRKLDVHSSLTAASVARKLGLGRDTGGAAGGGRPDVPGQSSFRNRFPSGERIARSRWAGPVRDADAGTAGSTSSRDPALHQ